MGSSLFRSRYALSTTTYSYVVAPERLFARVAEVASAAEATSFDTLWLPDHLVQGEVGDVAANRGDSERTLSGPNGTRTPIFDVPTLLAALVVTTKRINIGPLVSPVTWRHPAVLSKIITTVDVVSGGRARLGLGAAWKAEEHLRYGVEFPGLRERLGRLEDAVQICRAMLDDEAASHDGVYYSIKEAFNVPRPLSKHIPILVGGSGPGALRIAAKYADACNVFGRSEQLRRCFAAVDEECDAIGRDSAEVAHTASVVFHRIEDLYDAVDDAFTTGADGIVLIPWQLALTPDQVTTIGDTLAARFG